MLIPLAINHEKKRIPVVAWTLAALIAGIYVFFLVVPGWIIDMKRADLLVHGSFNPRSHLYYNLVACSFIYSNPFHLLVDLAALLFIGRAVEAALGWWKFLLIYLLSGLAAGALHGALQPAVTVVGGTGAIFGLVGAATLLFGATETECLSLVGMKNVWTIFVLAAYAVGMAAWSAWLTWFSRSGAEGPRLIGLWGLAAGLSFGLAAVAAMEGRALPVLNTPSLNPTTARRIREEERRKRIQAELAQEGLFVSGAEREVEAPSTALPGVDGAPPPQAHVFATEDARTASLDAMKQGLEKMMDMRNPTELSLAYRNFMARHPGEALEPRQQFALAQQLQANFYFDLALDAYEKLIWKHPRALNSPAALMQAGKLCAKVPGRAMHGLKYLERFLETEPLRRERLEAEQDMQELNAVIAKGDAPPAGVGAATPPSSAIVPERTPMEEFFEAFEPQFERRAAPEEPAPTPIFEAPRVASGDEPLRVDGLELHGPGGRAPQPAAAPAPPPPISPGPWQGPADATPLPLQGVFGQVTPVQPRGSDPLEIVVNPNASDLYVEHDRHAPSAPSTPEESRVVLEFDTVSPPHSKPTPLTPEPAGRHRSQPPPAPADPAPTPRAGAPEFSSSPDALYTLMLEPKRKVDLDGASRAMAARMGLARAEALAALQRRKGIVARDMPLEDAEALKEEIEARGQAIRLIAQTLDLAFPPPVDADWVELGERALVWRTGMTQTRTDPADMALLSAGRIVSDVESMRTRRALSVYFRNPPRHIRLWESMLRNREDPSLSGMSLAEAFVAVCRRLSDQCPGASRASGFRRVLEPRGSESPMIFLSEAEFDDYNLYHLLAKFGRQPGAARV